MAGVQLSRSDLHRAAELKWRNMPPGMPADLAAEIMTRLKAGSTVRKLTSGMKDFGPAIVSYARFKKHCELHPEWGAEAWRISKTNASLGKGAHNRIKTHCKFGHPFALYQRLNFDKGSVIRKCNKCHSLRYKEGGLVKPEVLVKVKAEIERGATISSLTAAGRPTRLLAHHALKRARREDPAFDRFVYERTKDNAKRGQLLRWQRVRNSVVREEQNDYYKIRAMLPASLSERDDIVSMIFEDLLAGALKREDVKNRIRVYISAHNQAFATKYRKFGDSPLLSLDEALFDDGSGTRGDTVSRGLWD
ncbi:hypothetical protein IVA98_32975 [Bradyrhizobium sp. 160]|uniref:hypothetical protein n=1 Tax=unclassified Bradyrhizobium TaxID=2631580 RepID=UPI001FFA3C23|nr:MULTISPECIES: hypothetical protein [unclassified Bradyrhizobium]MCK1542215.1 hypothetical protein [Bradyrhizobium sp. 179]MCK1627843.1 hypothetical protein [Bradyrhizobium sp. 160]